MAVELIHPPFTDVRPRNALKATALTVALTGRWVALDNNGLAIAPGAGATNVYLILEGTRQHLGGTTDFDGSGNSTVYGDYPTNVMSKAVALLYGPKIVTVGPEGFLQSDQANIIVGASLKVDTAGRLLSTTANAIDSVAIVESRTSDGSGNVLSATIRILR